MYLFFLQFAPFNLNPLIWPNCYSWPQCLFADRMQSCYVLIWPRLTLFHCVCVIELMKRRPVILVAFEIEEKV